MKVKVSLFSKQLLNDYLPVFSVISMIASILSLVYSIPETCKIYAAIIVVIILVVIYIVMWVYANQLKSIVLTINNSKVIVKVGDIFQEQGLRVIAFNEYFDTLVNERIISSSSLNGQFIQKYVEDVTRLDNAICESEHLSNPDRMLENNTMRREGKTQKYKLGSVCEYDGYLLTAFTKFDNDNRAYLSMVDYINCLLNFWNEVDIVFADRSVVVPLLGTGITRFREYTMSEQEKLELLLWSFKVSRIKFTYPAETTIVIHESIQDKINFYALKN